MKEKMKLYEITCSNYMREEYKIFIIAINRQQAMIKANTFDPKNVAGILRVRFICNRDEIIPTVEPIQEFKNQ